MASIINRHYFIITFPCFLININHNHYAKNKDLFYILRGKPDKLTPESMAPFLEITKSRRVSLSTSELHQVIKHLHRMLYTTKHDNYDLCRDYRGPGVVPEQIYFDHNVL